MLNHTSKIFNILCHLQFNYQDLIKSYNKLAEGNKKVMLENIHLEKGYNVLILQLKKTKVKLNKTQDWLFVALVAVSFATILFSVIVPPIASAPPVVAFVAAFLLLSSLLFLLNYGKLRSLLPTMPSVVELILSKNQLNS